MEENNLDKYFQEKLAGHTEEPPPAVWEGISSELPKSGFAWNKRYLLLLLLLISIGGATFLGIHLYDMDSRVAELENKIKTEKNEPISETEENLMETTEKNARKSSAANENSLEETFSEESREIAPKEPSPEKEFGENPRVEQLNEATSLVNRADDFDDSIQKTNQAKSVASTFGPFSNTAPSGKASESAPEMNGSTPIEPIQGESNSSENFHAKTTTSGSSASLEFNPTSLLSVSPFSAMNPEFNVRERKVDDLDEPGKDWYLFLYGMANYTHRRVVALAEGAEAIPNRLDKAENGLITPGAGLQVSRQLGKHFRLSIGAEYNQWIQEGSYDIEVPAEEVTIVTGTNTTTSEFSYGGVITSSFGSNFYSSSSTENPFGEEFTTLNPNADPLALQLETKQKVDYLSIPVTLEYVYTAYPFQFTVGGGISVNHIIGTDFSFNTDLEPPGFAVGEMNEVTGTYIAFQVGIGIEYGLSERMSLRLNPNYRGWMTPIFENEQIRTLPFGVAVRAGVVYRLGK